MSERFYDSGDEAARELGFELLVTSSSSPAVPRAGTRLSEYAVDMTLGARLFHRLKIPDEARSPLIWLTAPAETQEHLRWAVAVAEHASGAGRASYVAVLDTAERFLRGLAGGKGLPLPAGIAARMASLGIPAAAGWASDLQGVRLVLPAAAPPPGDVPPDPARSMIVVARALPEPGEGVEPLLGAADRVVLAAAIRDHAREELLEAAARLAKPGAPVPGLIAMGPVPAAARAAEKEPAPQAAPAAPAAPIAPAPPAPAPAPETAPAPEKEPAAPIPPVPEEAPAAAEAPIAAATPPVEEKVPLVAGWMPPSRRRIGPWVLLGVLVVAAAAGWWFRSDLARLLARPGRPSAPENSPAPPAPAPGQVALTPAWPDTYVIYLGTYRDAAAAGAERDRLVAAGADARLVEVVYPEGGIWQRVVIGAFPDSMAADATAGYLRRRGLIAFARIMNRGGRGQPPSPEGR